ncbi:MAG: ATP-binding protein [Patulibacter sp.]
MNSLPRHARARLEVALSDTRIVTVEGPRQAGKSTLCAAVAAARGLTSVTLDDPGARQRALEDPVGFISGLRRGAFIDEVQRAPDLLLVLKADVDRDPSPGRFLVSGSANLLLDPRIGDSLAGRVERVPLRPFTQAERGQRGVPGWLDELWHGAPPPLIEAEAGRAAYAEQLAAGGFPAVVARPPARRRAWFDDYVAALIARDVPDLVDVRRPDLLPVLLRHLAEGSSTLLRYRPIAEALSVSEKTIRSYVRLLELLHLVVAVPAWTPGVVGRSVQVPRIYIEDTGLMAHFVEADAARIEADGLLAGRAYETWVTMELQRLLPHTDVAPAMWHWRSAHGTEVDVVLEDRHGRVVAIEIKSGATIGRGDLRGINHLRDRLGERFVAGLVLCSAPQTQPCGDRAWIVPIAALGL